MSKTRIIKINCPFCGKEADFQIYDSVNVTVDPSLKEKVFNLDIFKFTCSHCNESQLMNYQFLYHDMEKNFMIMYAQEKDIVEWQYMMNPDDLINTHFGGDVMFNYTRRGVSTFYDLLSKLTVMDMDLNDILIEIIRRDCTKYVKEKRKKKNRHKLLYSMIEHSDNDDELLLTYYFEKEDQPECYVLDKNRYAYYCYKYENQLQYIDEAVINDEFIDKFTYDAKSYFEGMYQTDMKKLYCVYDLTGSFHICLESIDLREKVDVEDYVIIDIDGLNVKGKVAKIVEKSYYQLPKWGGHWNRIVARPEELTFSTTLASDDIIDDSKLKEALYKHQVEKVVGAYGTVLTELLNSNVIMPLVARPAEIDIEKILQLKVGDTFTGDIMYEKEIKEINEKRYLVIYSSDKEIADKTNYSIMKYDFNQVLDMARYTSNIHGIILNADTDKFIIDNESIRNFENLQKHFHLFKMTSLCCI